MKCVLFSYLCGIAAEKGEVRGFVNSQTSLSIAGDFTKNIYILFFFVLVRFQGKRHLLYTEGVLHLYTFILLFF